MAAHVVDAREIGAGGAPPGGFTLPANLPSIEGYEVRQQLGETPASDVYLAAHTASGVLRTIAVQRTENDPAAVRRIVREVLEASRVKHPNVALVDGVGTTRDGRLYVATAYIPGTSLAELLESEGHLPARRAVQIALRAAEALEAAHKLGVMHGDLTPEHIIVGPAGTDGVDPVGVTGFGMCAARTGSATPVAPSKQARPYASPERVSGGPIDARSDVFSLASIMLHALSGNAPPPPRASSGRGITPTSSAAIQPGARLAPAQVLLAARAVEPDRRYPSAAVFRNTLAAAFGGGEETRRTPDAAHAIAAVAASASPAPSEPLAVERTAAAITPAAGAPINPFLRRTPASPMEAVALPLGEPPAAAAPTPASVPLVPPVVAAPAPARWELPPAELQPPQGLVLEPIGGMAESSPAAPLAFGPPPTRVEPHAAELPAPVLSPEPVNPFRPSTEPAFADAYSPLPADAPVDDDFARREPVATAAATPIAGSPARRRGAMIGGAVAASLIVGAWALLRTPPAGPGLAPAATGGQPAPVLPASMGGLTAAVARPANPARDDAAPTTAMVASAADGAPAPVTTGRTAAPAESEPASAEAALNDDAPPMPKVVLPDVAVMRATDINPGDAQLSQGALSEVSSSGSGLATSQPAPDGLVVDAATRSQINAAMARFAHALESRDMNTLRQAYPGITVAERNTWSAFFRSAESIRARFTAQDFQVMPDGVDVNAVGKLTFFKRDTRQQTENAVTFRVLLSQARGGGGFVMKRIH